MPYCTHPDFEGGGRERGRESERKGGGERDRSVRRRGRMVEREEERQNRGREGGETKVE